MRVKRVYKMIRNRARRGLYLRLEPRVPVRRLLLTWNIGFFFAAELGYKRVGVWIGKCLDAIAQLHAFVRGCLRIHPLVTRVSDVGRAEFRGQHLGQLLVSPGES